MVHAITLAGGLATKLRKYTKLWHDDSTKKVQKYVEMENVLLSKLLLSNSCQEILRDRRITR
jgi:hypothetical protein